MSFDPIRDKRGHPRMKCTCDECGRDEVVAADHGKDESGMAGQAVTKLKKRGWTHLKKVLRCPGCEAKRKVVHMSDRKKPEVVGGVDRPNRQPTRAQKREIMALLDDVYDVEAERYRAGDTDATVADVLDVLPGWVAEIREEFYGPDGGNAEIELLTAQIEEFMARAPDLVKTAKIATDALDQSIKTVADMKARLERIKVAVGPRVLAKSGVR